MFLPFCVSPRPLSCECVRDISGSRSITSYMWYCGHPRFCSLCVYKGGSCLWNSIVIAPNHKHFSETMVFCIARRICLIWCSRYFIRPSIYLVLNSAVCVRTSKRTSQIFAEGPQYSRRTPATIKIESQLRDSPQMNTNYQGQRCYGCIGRLYRSPETEL